MNYNLDTDEGMANAVQWTTDIFAKLQNNGVWIVPRSGTMVHVNHKDKIATIHVGAVQDTSIIRVIKAMGWTVKE